MVAYLREHPLATRMLTLFHFYQMTENEKMDETVKELLENVDEVIEKASAAEEPAVEETPKKKTSSKTAAVSLFLSAAVIFLLYVIFAPRNAKRSPFLPVPYVFNAKYQKLLSKFAVTKGHSQVLVVTGPKGVGKTRGMQEFMSRNNHTQNTPFFLNFESLPKSISANDFLQFLMQSLSDAMKLVDGKIFVNQTILSQQVPYLSGVQTKCPQQYVAQIKDLSLVKIADIAYGILHCEEKKGSVTHSVLNFFEFINKQSVVSPYVRMCP